MSSKLFFLHADGLLQSSFVLSHKLKRSMSPDSLFIQVETDQATLTTRTARHVKDIRVWEAQYTPEFKGRCFSYIYWKEPRVEKTRSPWLIATKKMTLNAAVKVQVLQRQESVKQGRHGYEGPRLLDTREARSKEPGEDAVRLHCDERI